MWEESQVGGSPGGTPANLGEARASARDTRRRVTMDFRPDASQVAPLIFSPEVVKRGTQPSPLNSSRPEHQQEHPRERVPDSGTVAVLSRTLVTCGASTQHMPGHLQEFSENWAPEVQQEFQQAIQRALDKDRDERRATKSARAAKPANRQVNRDPQARCAPGLSAEFANLKLTLPPADHNTGWNLQSVPGWMTLPQTAPGLLEKIARKAFVPKAALLPLTSTSTSSGEDSEATLPMVEWGGQARASPANELDYSMLRTWVTPPDGPLSVWPEKEWGNVALVAAKVALLPAHPTVQDQLWAHEFPLPQALRDSQEPLTLSRTMKFFGPREGAALKERTEDFLQHACGGRHFENALNVVGVLEPPPSTSLGLPQNLSCP